MKNENGIEKSATLKGQTLVNYATSMSFALSSGGDYCIGTLKNSEMTSNKTITIVNNNSYDVRGVVTNLNGGWIRNINISAESHVTSTLTSSEKLMRVDSLSNSDILLDDYANSRFIFYDGNFKDVIYFEGMQSVKMPVLTTTGKNLFDINNNSRNLSGDIVNFQPLTFEGNQVSVTSKYTCSLQYLVKLKPNTKYTVTVSERNEHNKGSQFRIAGYSPTESSFTADWNNLFVDIHLNNNKSQSSFVTDATGYIVASLNPKSGNEFLTSTFYNIQLEEGSVATSYEPFKSYI